MLDNNYKIQNKNWNTIGCSKDGKYVITCIYGGGLWRSTDYGASFTINQTNYTQNRNWKSLKAKIS